MHMISYISESKMPPQTDCAQMRDLVSRAQAHNQAHGITGVLFLRGPIFFQTMEGPKDAVHDVFQKIRNDDRHCSVYPLLDEPITERRFAQWSMEAFHDPHCQQHFLGVIHNLGKYFLESGAFTPSSVAAYSWRLVANMAPNRLSATPGPLHGA